MSKIWPKVKVMTWSEKVILHISRSVSWTWIHIRRFHRYSLSLSSYYRKKRLVTVHDLWWFRAHEEGSLVAIFRFRASSLPVYRCLIVFGMMFVQNGRLSISSHWLPIMEKLQNCPDLRSPIYKFRDVNFIDTVTHNNCWKCQGDRSVGVAMTIFQTFSEVRSLDVTWCPDLERTRSEIFTCAE